MEKLFIRFTEPRIPLTRDGYEFAAIIYCKKQVFITDESDIGQFSRRTLFVVDLHLAQDVDIKDLQIIMPSFIQDVKNAAIKAIQDAEVET